MSRILDLLSPCLLIHLLVLRPFLRLFCGVRVAGRENIDVTGPSVIIANHNSHFDTLFLFYILPVLRIRKTHAVAAKDYFSRSRILFALASLLFSPVWLDRGKQPRGNNPLKEMEHRLAEGHSVILFPEGTRGQPGEMQHFKSGLGRLIANHPDIPIVPVVLLGPERVLPKGRIVPLPLHGEIIISPPQKYRGEAKDISRTLEAHLVKVRENAMFRRHQRDRKPKTTSFTIAVLGIDGSGKSTLSGNIARELSHQDISCCISDELRFYEKGQPKEMQPLLTETLRRFISRHAKKAKSLKLYKIPKLTELFLRDHLVDEVKRWHSPDVIVLDGCPLLNMVGWASIYHNKVFDEDTYAKLIAIMSFQETDMPKNDPILKEFPELRSLKLLRLNHLSLPDAIILIDIDPSLACRRIQSRGQQKQVHETEAKLSTLRKAYKAVCQVTESHWGLPTRIVQGDQTLDETLAESLSF